MKTTIALIGRPNVGKSALFNRIVGKPISIVDEKEGVTRDRLYGSGNLFGHPFQVIDTGGLDFTGKTPFAQQIREQVERAIEEGDSLIIVVDGRVGVTCLDEQVVRLLRGSSKPLCLAVNKIDEEHQEELIAPFYGLGIPEVIPISAIQGRNVAELLERGLAPFKKPKGEKKGSAGMKVALIGRPNVGKSTMINHLLDQDRCIVSPISGTTRDHIDVDMQYDDQKFTFIDTAGVRRKKAELEVVDKFASIRTERAIDRADVCVLMLDARSGLSHQEKKIISQIERAGKGCLLFFNKWDLVRKVRMEHCSKSLELEAPFIKHAPTLFGSAKTGHNLKLLFDKLKEVYHDLNRRISTGKLNQFLEKAMSKQHPPMIQGKRLCIYYVSQTEAAPPRFLFFINNKKYLQKTYEKYLINRLRDSFRFSGTPLRFTFREKRRT